MSRTRSLFLAAVASLALTLPASAKELKTLGISVGSMGNPFFVAMVKGAEAQIKDMGLKTKVIAGGVDYDLNKQFTQLDNFIAAGVDMVLLNAADPVAIEPAVKRLQAAGIVVVATDVSAKGADATVMTDNPQAGRIACDFIVKKLDGKGNVLIVNGPPVSSVVDRVKGCKEAFSKAPGIKVLSDNQNAKGSREGGLEVTVGLLTANDKVDAIFAINDPTGIGANLAAKQLNRTNLFITSVDGAPDIETALKDKDGLILASSSQDPFTMARKAVQVGVDILNGKKPENPVTLLPAELITRDNVNSYQGWATK